MIEHAAKALIGRGHEVVVLASEIPPEPTPYPVSPVHALRYTLPNEKIDPGALAFELKRAARKVFGQEPDVWHFHNHCLGKNAAVPEVVGKLALERPILLQIHDFAEDGRPSNYTLLRTQLSDISRLYPIANHIHYAVLNGRDRAILQAANIPEANLHYLPNAVALPDVDEAPAEIPELAGRRLVLYPTRGIRRKNMGEFLLHSTLADSETLHAATLGPANPSARPIYEQWMAFAEACSLPALFGLGERDYTFSQLMAAADHVVTTSVAEGFGLAFLEPWLFGKPLVGRDLAEVTGEFKTQAVRLDGLYDRLDIPTDWFDVGRFRGRMAEALQRYYHEYGEPLPLDAPDTAWNALYRDGQVDFGHLDEPAQEAVIRHLVEDTGARDYLRERLTLAPHRTHLQENFRAVAESFSLREYGQHLESIYSRLQAAEISGLNALPWDLVLREFLKPERFCMLRT